jgi:hypothetical protein
MASPTMNDLLQFNTLGPQNIYAIMTRDTPTLIVTAEAEE